MVQKSEELRESGAAPYFDVSCAVVSLVSTSLMWSDRTVITPRFHPLQLLVHTYIYTTDFITIHAAVLFWFVGWAYFGVINDTLQITFSENGGWAYFWGVGVLSRGYGIYADINECELNYGSGSGSGSGSGRALVVQIRSV